MSLRRPGLQRVLPLVLCLSLLLAPLSVHAQRKTSHTSYGLSRQPSPIIIPGNPLRILVGSNSSIQVYYVGYAQGQVFGDADSGIFVWVNGRVYGPNLEGRHAESAANVTLELQTIRHAGPSGNGTASDPWVVETVLDVGATGLRITQRASYVQGDEHFGLTWDLENRSAAPISFDLFHAADLFFAGDDYGYGYYDPETGAVGGYNRDRTWYMTFIPRTPATRYKEADFGVIWDDIGHCTADSCFLGVGFDNTISSQWLDNGIGLQWHVELPAGQSTQIGDYWTFGAGPMTPAPEPTETPTRPPVPTSPATPRPTKEPPLPPEIPETSSLVLLATGLGALAGCASLRRRRKQG